MLFVSSGVVLVHFKDDKVVHFKADGTVLHQVDEEVSKLFEDNVDLECESEILNESKYVVFRDKNGNC